MTAVAHATRDWSALVRGPLPPLTPPARPARVRGSLARLFAACIPYGLAIGATMGAITALVGFLHYDLGTALVAATYGLVVGAAVALPFTVILGMVVTAVAAVWHHPLRKPADLQRHLWVVFVLATALIVTAAVVLLAHTGPPPRGPGVKASGHGQIASLYIGAWTLLLVLLLRSALRHLVISYAMASGWTVTPGPRSGDISSTEGV